MKHLSEPVFSVWQTLFSFIFPVSISRFFLGVRSLSYARIASKILVCNISVLFSMETGKSPFFTGMDPETQSVYDAAGGE